MYAAAERFNLNARIAIPIVPQRFSTRRVPSLRSPRRHRMGSRFSNYDVHSGPYPGHSTVVYADADAYREEAVYESRSRPTESERSTPSTYRPDQAPRKPSIVVFSGGTAFNSVAERITKWTTYVSYVMPVSDDGGSTAEIVRVVGGPAVGDIRSRCLRLADKTDVESRAVRSLLGHRLSIDDAHVAKCEWMEIVEGRHQLWTDVTDPYKHTIRAFLIFFQNEILRNCRTHFDYRNGSVGNFFFAGARLFFHSLEAAIFLFSRVARIPEGSKVLPAIQTEERIILSAQLENGKFIRGQSEISHPRRDTGASIVDKNDDGTPLPAAIHRVFYLASEGTGVEHEVQFQAHHAVLSAIEQTDMVIYGIGSLYTSVCCTLILKGIGETIVKRNCPKVLMLNGGHDRETRTRRGAWGPMSAVDVVQALVDALNRMSVDALNHTAGRYITTVLYPRNGAIEVDRASLESMGIKSIIQVDSIVDHSGEVKYKPDGLIQALAEEASLGFYHAIE